MNQQSFYKYWPDVGLFRPRLVANIWNYKTKKIVVSDAVHIEFNYTRNTVKGLCLQIQ